jgi:hypothetical protein
MEAAAGEIANARRASQSNVGRLAVEVVLALVVLGLWAGAFVGLDASGYWIDELWTLFVVDHSGGAAEVVRRALTDTHPPLFYLIAHYWVQAFGDSETATRSFSAVLGVAATALLVACNGQAFSRSARLFAAAAGASSFFWFKQSQNLRSYMLAMLLLTALLQCALAAKRQSRAGSPVSWGLCAAIAALGLVGSWVHYYLFLAVGLLYLALLVGVSDRRLRTTVVLGGAVILATLLPYMHVARSRLIFTNLWFSNDLPALQDAMKNAGDMVFDGWTKCALFVLAVGAAYGLWRRRRDRKAPEAGAAPLGRWIAGVSLFVAVGLLAVGLAVSFLVQPSFSARNLLIAAPCAWFLAAWLYDEAALGAPRAGFMFAGLAGVLMVFELLPLSGRLLNRVEDWRGSAQYVGAQAACHGRDIAVVLPDVFGPDTPFFRRLAERDLFGWYYRGGGRLVARTRTELATSRDPALVAMLGARASGTDPCRVLAWGVHDIHDAEAQALAQALSRRPEIKGPVNVHRIPSYRRAGDGWEPGWPAAYVFERTAKPGSTLGTTSQK